MLIKSTRKEIPVISQWADGQYPSEIIDPNDFWMLCDWCYRYGANPEDGDTRDLLYRWNIGVYQLHYVGKMLRQNFVAEEEWAESIASILIHMISSWEMAGINVAGLCKTHKENFCEAYVSSGDVSLDRVTAYHNVLESIPTCTRQLLYKAQHRKVRYNEGELKKEIPFLVFSIKKLHELGQGSYTFGEALALALDKLQAREFRNH